jgi:hypothetical protein
MSGLEDILGGMLGGGGGQGSAGRDPRLSLVFHARALERAEHLLQTAAAEALHEERPHRSREGGNPAGAHAASAASASAHEPAQHFAEPASTRAAENKPISAGELEKVFGTDEIDKVAAATGADRETAANMLAQALPQVVDQVTPDGKLPDQSQLDAALGKVLEGK